MTMTMTIKTILLSIKTVCGFYNVKVMQDLMSADQTWEQRIRLRTQATTDNNSSI